MGYQFIVKMEGTTEGAIKGWDVRGRGKTENLNASEKRTLLKDGLRERIGDGNIDIQSATKEDVRDELKDISRINKIRLSDNELDGIASEFV